MKASNYNVATANPETGELILFNTLYGSTVVVEKERKQEVVDLLSQPDMHVAKGGSLPGLPSELVRLKFIVNDDIDELEILRNRKRAGINDRNRLDVILMPNLYCNFACPYCYEVEVHDRSKKITPEVESRISRWLEKEIPKHKVLLLNWFGGEPFLTPDVVLSITAFARAKCLEQGVRLLSNVTTNGYLLTEHLIAQLIALDLMRFQITVDGPPDTHNRTRVLRSGKGSFERIYNNILALTKADSRVKISLRVNYNHNNIREIPRLLEMFPEEIRQQLRVVFEPIFGRAELSATQNIPGDEISRLITRYYELAELLGYDIRLGGLGVGKLVYCYAERENQYIIDFKGDVFKCSITDFSPSRRVGALDTEGSIVRDEQSWSKWFGLDLFEKKCEECTFLPLCMGGCRKERIAHGATGSYCNLVPTNTSHVLKSIAFGSFRDVLRKEIEVSRACANRSQSCMNCE